MVICARSSGLRPQSRMVARDPTDAMLAGEDHAALAVGRNYADVAAIDGVVFAAGGQRLAVTVSVTSFG